MLPAPPPAPPPGPDAAPALALRGVSKGFTMHLQGGRRLDVLRDVSFDVRPGECVALRGPSGTGKSSVLKMIHGDYACEAGAILVRDRGTEVDVARAGPRAVLALRRRTLAAVTQFLRVIPRVSALDLVADAAFAREDALRPGLEGAAREAARSRAREAARALLARLNLPERVWDLAPATFSGGEQQRVNVARGLAGGHPCLLVDEPTASLDAANAAAVVDLLQERKRGGAAILGVFHDDAVRDALADRAVDVAPARPAETAPAAGAGA